MPSRSCCTGSERSPEAAAPNGPAGPRDAVPGGAPMHGEPSARTPHRASHPVSPTTTEPARTSPGHRRAPSWPGCPAAASTWPTRRSTCTRRPTRWTRSPCGVVPSISAARPLRRAGVQGAVHPPVGDLWPPSRLRVEVGRGGEEATGQERGLQIAAGPLDQTLGLRVAGPAQDHLAGRQAGQGGELLPQHGSSLAPASDGRLVVPHQCPRHCFPAPTAAPGARSPGRRPAWTAASAR